MNALPIHRRPYATDTLPEMVAFCEAHNASGHPPGLINTLIGSLASGPDAIIDLWEGDRQVLVAVVLDQLQNTDDAAECALLGYRPAMAPQSLWPVLCTLAEQIVAAGPRRSIGIGLGEGTAAMAPFLLARGYRQNFTCYGMTTAKNPRLPGRIALEAPWQWRPLDEPRVRAYYEAVRATLGTVPGTQTPAYADFAALALAARIPPQLLYQGDRLAGFFKVVLKGPDGTVGYINSLGRMPEFHGQGMGVRLLAEAMHQLAALGARSFALEVVATNDAALSLYAWHGFAVTSEEPHFLWHLPH
ncbi:MAG: GNAT family N-acetyltransferase [Candidatus Sericytochromatia bacterium]|nr:GNAT family N-acetyltransferase [Candidatus Sericytochromatia bacterium]